MPEMKVGDFAPRSFWVPEEEVATFLGSTLIKRHLSIFKDSLVANRRQQAPLHAMVGFAISSAEEQQDSYFFETKYMTDREVRRNLIHLGDIQGDVFMPNELYYGTEAELRIAKSAWRHEPEDGQYGRALIGNVQLALH